MLVVLVALLWADHMKGLHCGVSSKRPRPRSTYGVCTACVGDSRKTYWSGSTDHRSRCHQRGDVRRDQRLTNGVSSIERSSADSKCRFRSQTPGVSILSDGDAAGSVKLLAERSVTFRSSWRRLQHADTRAILICAFCFPSCWKHD